jgi:hypothetical protein
MTAQQAAIKPGPVVLMGSGETSPAAQKIFHRVFATIADDLEGWAAWKLTTFGQQLATFGKLIGSGGMVVW